jgi:hypothetical protein
VAAVESATTINRSFATAVHRIVHRRKGDDMVDKEDDNHGHGYRLPKIEDHVGEELSCEAEVTQEHIQQLREVIYNQRQVLIAVHRILWDLLPDGDWRIEQITKYLNRDATPWIK